MAGTGLPIPKSGDVLTQPTNVVDADRYSSARAWGQIAQAGAGIAKAGGDTLAIAEHQARVGYTADYQEKDRRRRIELGDEHRDNPQAFDAAWTGYHDGVLSETSPWAVEARRRTLGMEGNSAYAGILHNSAMRTERNAAEAVRTRVTSTANDVIGAAMAGTLVPSGPGGEVQDPRLLEYRNVLQSAVSARLHSQEWADAHMDDTMSKAFGESAARSALDIYRQPEGGGFAAATEHLRKNILENEGMRLSLAGKRAAFARGMQALRLQQAEDKQERGDVIEVSKDIRARLDSRQPVDAGEIRDTLAALRRTGAKAEEHRLTVTQAVAEATAPYRDGLKLREFAGQVANMRSGEFFASRGAPRVQGVSTDFAGRLQQAITDAETATGEKAKVNSLHRTREEQQAAYDRFLRGQTALAAPPGTSRHEIGEAADIQPGKVLDWLHQNAHKYGLEFLTGDNFRRDPVHIQLSKSGEGRGEVITAPPAGLPHSGEITARVQKVLVQQAKGAWPETKELIKQGKILDDEDFNAIRYTAAVSGDSAWQQEVEALAAAQQIGQRLGAPGVSMAERRAGIDFALSAAREGGLPAIDQDAISKSLNAQYERRNKLARENPVGYMIELGARPPDPINIDNPQQAAGAVADRVSLARTVAANERIPVGSPFTDADKQTLAAGISSGDANRAAAAITALGQVPQEFADAAFSGRDNPIREALAGAAVSSDPAKMTAANALLDRYWRAGPNEFEGIFTKSVLDKLQVWQSIKDAYSPAEVAEQFAKARDPKEEAARKLLDEPIKTELKAVTVASVAKGFSTSWVPFTAPPQPVNFEVRGIDGLASERLMAEYKDVYTALRKSGVPADQAGVRTQERLATSWGVSGVNGGAITRLPPEKRYPTVNGSHSWMLPQLDRMIAEAKGEDTALVIEAAIAGAGVQRNWTFRTLVADAQTESEISERRRPSYVIIIRNAATGRDEVLTDGAGNSRFAFDPRPEIAAVETAMRKQRAEMIAAEPRELAAEAQMRELLRLR